MEQEDEFFLESKDFYRPPLKQIGASVFETKKYFTKRDAITVIPSSNLKSSHKEVKDAFNKLVDKGGLLSRQNILTCTSVPTDSNGGFMFLADSLAMVLDFPISRRPNSAECDAFIALPHQPLVVLTLIEGEKETLDARMYNTYVARCVTAALRRFTADSVNVICGMLCLKDLKDVSRIETKFLQIAKQSSVGVPGKSLSMNPLKYERTMTAFWAAVSETKAIVRRTGDGDTEFLHFLTTEQCITLVENINNKDVQVKFLPGCGATTLMVEVARRLSRLNNTLLVCKSQEEADSLRSVYPDVTTSCKMEGVDLSKFHNVAAETEVRLNNVTGKQWTFTQASYEADSRQNRKRSHTVETGLVSRKTRRTTEISRLTYIVCQIERKIKAGEQLSNDDYADIDALHHRIEKSQKTSTNKHFFIDMLSSYEKQDKLVHLSREIESMKLLDIYIQGLHSSSRRLGFQSKGVKNSSADVFSAGEGEGCQQDVLDQMKLGILDRKELFPVLGDVIKQDKMKISYLRAKTTFLKQATSDLLFKDYFTEADSEITLPESGRSEQDAVEQAHSRETGAKDDLKGANETEFSKLSKSNLEDSSLTKAADMEKIAAIKQSLKTMEMETHQQDVQMSELSEASDHLVEWEYNMHYLSQVLASISMREFITDIIGEDHILVLHNEDSPPDHECSYRTRHKRGCHVYQMRTFQYGRMKQKDIVCILKNVIRADLSELSSRSTTSDHLEQVYGSPVCMVGEVDSARSGPVSCPAMTLQTDREHGWLDMSEDGQELGNWRKSKWEHQRFQFQTFEGTCSRLPIPPHSLSTLTTPTYWETNTQVQVKSNVPVFPLLEMGVSEKEVDTGYWIHFQSHSWAVCVRPCNKHGDYCTQVWGKGSQCGVCLTDTLTCTPGTDGMLKYGVVVDIGRGRLAFLDLNRGIVLHRFNVKICESLRPIFSVSPVSDECDVTMRLISGRDITMDDRKQNLIAEALFIQ